MDKVTVIKVRKGMNGFPFSACTSDGHFIINADNLDQIKEIYAVEIKSKRVKLQKELDKYPEGYEPQNTIYGYARVSTRGQAKDGNSLEAQEEQLRAAGATVIYKEAFTGKVTDRPELDKLLKVLKGGDTLIITKLDRVARSVIHGEQFINALLDRRVTVNILNMGILDNTPGSKLMRQMFFAFAEFEREMIVTRTQEGKAEAKKKPGFKEGRPPVDPKRLDHAMELLQDHSYNQVADLTGISVSTLAREKRRRKAAEPEQPRYVLRYLDPDEARKKDKPKRLKWVEDENGRRLEEF